MTNYDTDYEMDIDIAATVHPTSTATDFEEDTNSFLSSQVLCMLCALLVFVLVSTFRIWFFEGYAAQRRRYRALQARLQKVKNALYCKTLQEQDIYNKKVPTLKRLDSDGDSTVHEEDGDLDVERAIKTTGPESQIRGGRSREDGVDQSDDNDEHEEKDVGQVCQICLCEFRSGEEVCWSHNPACIHKFHVDCLTPWLLEKDECPLCRQPYMARPVDDQTSKTSTDRNQSARTRATPTDSTSSRTFPPIVSLFGARLQRVRERSANQESTTDSSSGRMGSGDISFGGPAEVDEKNVGTAGEASVKKETETGSHALVDAV